MAKQDLYKTAQQSAKLFKLIQDENLLESWVKNKIISAAEDISTVYQYLNYEKQFKDYSKMISESTDLSESKRAVLTSKLAEAKEKVKELKKKAAKDKSEKMSEDKDEMKVGDTKKTRTGELTKTSTGVVHKNTSYHDDGDEIASNAKSGKGVKSHAKAQSAAEKKEQAPKQKQSPKSAKTWGMKDNEKFDNRDKVDEAKWRDAKHKDKLYTQEPRDYDQYDYHDTDYYNGPKPDDYPGEKNLKGGGEFDHNDPLRKGYGRGGTGSTNTHGKRKGLPSRDHISSLKGSIKSARGTHTEPSLPEAKQTMSRAAKGHEKYGKEGMAALAKAGKEGKSLEPIKAKYNKYDEGTMPMKKVGGKSVPAFAADGKGKDDLAKKKGSDKVKEAIARAKDVLEGKSKKKDKMDMEGNAFGKAVRDAKADGIQKGEKVKVGGKDIPLKESTELDRLKVLTQRLNG